VNPCRRHFGSWFEPEQPNDGQAASLKGLLAGASQTSEARRLKQDHDRGNKKGTMMKRPILSIDEPEPKKAVRADRPPTEGFATIVDGHFKSEFGTIDGAEAAGRALKSAYPMLQIEIYDAATKVRSVLS
jgi:hypothetical protein